MSGKPLVHRGTRSWWNGDVTTLCGLVIPSGTGRSPWFVHPACPECEARHKARRKGGK